MEKELPLLQLGGFIPELEPDLQGDHTAALTALKVLVHEAQHQAQLVVKTDIIELYWKIGRSIFDLQADEPWGSRVLNRLARDLKAEFPQIRGFSQANLYTLRTLAAAWDG